MEEIFDKLENIFEKKDTNEYCKEILKEIREIKNILKFSHKEHKTEYQTSLPKEYFEFVERLKAKMKPSRDYNPTLEFEGMRLGINERGLLYDKESGKILPKFKAFYIYEKLFFEKIIKV